MPKSVISAWVKNVYSLLIRGGKDRGHSPTLSLLEQLLTTQPVHKHSSFPRFVLTFPLSLSTANSDDLSLLNSYLYPLSTPPINTKTKGK